MRRTRGEGEEGEEMHSMVEKKEFNGLKIGLDKAKLHD